MTVSRRQVFFVPGFDPQPPRRYRELYRVEAAQQGAISGHRIAVMPRDGARFGWHVSATIEGRAVETDVEVLVWSDLVRASMRRGILATYAALARTVWIYLVTGAFLRLARLRKGPVIAALYPVAVLTGELALAVGAGALVAAALPWWGVVFGLAVTVVLLRWFRALDGRLLAHYLMHDFHFFARRRGAPPPALETRLADFAARIAAALDAPVDEVLVVGHSTGAQLAVMAVADVLRGRTGPAAPLALLTLGQAMPMVAFLPDAHRLRADLHLLGGSDALTWVDVSAPGDGCAFALCDPVAVAGVGGPGKRWPLVVSAAFSLTLAPARWKKLRWRFFRLHFQYLCAFDRPRGYDYFAVTAGPRGLAGRFARHPPSPARIETPLSGYRDRAA